MKRPSKWRLILIWVAIAALVNLAAAFHWIPYKLYEFLFLFWICISLVGGIPVGLSVATDLEEWVSGQARRERQRQHEEELAAYRARPKRIFNYKTGKVEEK